MKFEYHLFHTLNPAIQSEVAEYISAFSKGELDEKPQMLPVEPEDIFNKFVGVVAFESETGKHAGYVGATNPMMHNGVPMCEVGTLVVKKEYRHQNAAHVLVRLVSHYNLLVAGAVSLALTNQKSDPIFAESKYVHAEPSEVPASVFESCIECPMYEQAMQCGKICCDNLVMFDVTS